MNATGMLRAAATKLLRASGRRNGSRLELLGKMPPGSVCAEIGVWKGDFSEQIRKITSPKELHLIDPWIFQNEFPGRMYGGTVARSQRDMDAIYEGVKRRFRGCPDVVLDRGRSEVVLPGFPDAYFGWVYIDGNHYYDFVRRDLENCLRKVRSGGAIAGDDYTWGEAERWPVRRAVGDFVRVHGLERGLEILDSQFVIWL